MGLPLPLPPNPWAAAIATGHSFETEPQAIQHQGAELTQGGAPEALSGFGFTAAQSGPHLLLEQRERLSQNDGPPRRQAQILKPPLQI